MKKFFAFSAVLSFSLCLCLPAAAWGADSVDIGIAVVLAKEKRTEALPPEAFAGERHEHSHKDRHEKPGKSKKDTPKNVAQVEQLESEDLVPMHRALKLRRHYAWLQRFSKKHASIDAKGEVVELPGGGKARIRLAELKNDVATLEVSLPNTETVYQLGRRGTLYLQAGKHEDKEVWLVIFPKKQFR